MILLLIGIGLVVFIIFMWLAVKISLKSLEDNDDIEDNEDGYIEESDETKD